MRSAEVHEKHYHIPKALLKCWCSKLVTFLLMLLCSSKNLLWIKENYIYKHYAVLTDLDIHTFASSCSSSFHIFTLRVVTDLLTKYCSEGLGISVLGGVTTHWSFHGQLTYTWWHWSRDIWVLPKIWHFLTYLIYVLFFFVKVWIEPPQNRDRKNWIKLRWRHLAQSWLNYQITQFSIDLLRGVYGSIYICWKEYGQGLKKCKI